NDPNSEKRDVSAGLGEARLHRFGKRSRPRQRPHHNGQLAHLTALVEAQQVEAGELTVAHPRLEDQRRGVAAVEPLDVAKVLEDLNDGAEDGCYCVAALVRLVDDRAPKDDVLGEGVDDRRRTAGPDRALEGLD